MYLTSKIYYCLLIVRNLSLKILLKLEIKVNFLKVNLRLFLKEEILKRIFGRFYAETEKSQK